MHWDSWLRVRILCRVSVSGKKPKALIPKAVTLNLRLLSGGAEGHGRNKARLRCLKISLCSKFKMSTSASSSFVTLFSAISGLIILRAPFGKEGCIYLYVYTFRCCAFAMAARNKVLNFQLWDRTLLAAHQMMVLKLFAENGARPRTHSLGMCTFVSLQIENAAMQTRGRSKIWRRNFLCSCLSCAFFASAWSEHKVLRRLKFCFIIFHFLEFYFQEWYPLGLFSI